MSNQSIEAYARLKSLRQNLPKGDIATKFIDEFHAILGLLQGKMGADLASFRIPPTEVRPVVTGGNVISGRVDYSDEPYCDYAFFVMKLDGVITMFELLLQRSASGREPVIFNPPQNS